jgi:hypothetical protein
VSSREKAREKELCTKPVSRPGLCPLRGQAIKSADPQGWSAEGGEAEGGRLEVSRKDSDGVLARPCCRCATAHGCAAAAAEPPSGQERRGEEGRKEGDPRVDPRKPLLEGSRKYHEVPCVTRRARWRRHLSRGPRGRGDGEAGCLDHAHQHRSPDPTKIERATVTSTVALYLLFFSFLLYLIGTSHSKCTLMHLWWEQVVY